MHSPGTVAFPQLQRPPSNAAALWHQGVGGKDATTRTLLGDSDRRNILQIAMDHLTHLSTALHFINVLKYAFKLKHYQNSSAAVFSKLGQRNLRTAQKKEKTKESILSSRKSILDTIHHVGNDFGGLWNKSATVLRVLCLRPPMGSLMKSQAPETEFITNAWRRFVFFHGS